MTIFSIIQAQIMRKKKPGQQDKKQDNTPRENEKTPNEDKPES
jgi:hypothetical protein